MPVVTDEPIDGSYPPDGDDMEFPSQRMRKGGVKAKQSRILAKERQRRALELRKSGATYDAIGQALGYSDQSGARSAVVRALGELIQEPAKEVRTLQIERLNHMLLVLWAKVQTGDEKAIATALQIIDKIDRIMGTEAPTKHEHAVAGAVLVVDGDKEAYIRAMQRMTGEAPPEPIEAQALEAPTIALPAPTAEEAGFIDVPNLPVPPVPHNGNGNGIVLRTYNFKVKPDDEAE